MPHAALNGAVTALDPPPIPAVQRAASRYDGRLGPLVDLSQAVPGYPPHPLLMAALAAAAGDAGLLGYGSIEGEPELRAAYAAHLSRRHGGRGPQIGEVLISAGCNQAFVVATLALVGAGRAMLLPEPCYFNHASTLAMLGIRTRYYRCDAAAGFVPDPATIARAIDDEVAAVALVTPANPTGAICPPERLDAVLDVCAARGVWLVLDETYRDFLPSAAAAHDLYARETPWQENLVGLASFSKSWCIPAHRLGAIVAGEAVVAEIAKVMDNVQICAPRVPQVALARLLERLDGWREGNRLEIVRRGDALARAFAALRGWEIASLGAYFAYVSHPWSGEPSARVAERLAAERGVVTLPGSFFGANQDAYLRLAFANVDQGTIWLLPERLGG